MEVIQLNPLQNAREHMAFVMKFLVEVAGETVPEAVQTKAQEVLEPLVAAHPDLSIVGVVEAFEQVPELKTFAASIRKAALPGAFGKYFNPDEYHHLAAAK